MKKYNLQNAFIRGWIIGDFQPSVLQTKDFEIAVLTHSKDQAWPKHYHKLATEYNVLLEGYMSVNGEEFIKDDVFVIEPNEVAVPIFHTDCKVLCIKVPSIPGDKYEVV